MTTTTEMENVLRSKLEASGQLAKMKSMVVATSLKVLASESPEAADEMFTQSPSLKSFLQKPDSLVLASVVNDFLTSIGLHYTASVFQLELNAKKPFLSRSELTTAGFPQRGAESILVQVLTSRLPSVVESVPSKSVDVKPAATKPTNLSTESQASAELAAAAPSLIPTLLGKVGKSEDSKFFISKWESKEFVRFQQVAGQQVQVEYLKKCKVFVLDPLDSMTIDDCEDCEFIVAACEGSIFLRTSKRVVIHAACKQFRTRDCEDCEARLFAATDPVVEASHHITFKPFHLQLPKLMSSFAAAKLDASVNRFVHVYDFTADDSKLPTPHFLVQYPAHGLQIEARLEKFGPPEAPKEIRELLEGKLQPAASSESGQNKSHNIKSGAAVWTGTGQPPTKVPTVGPSTVPIPSVSKAPPTALPTKVSAAPKPSAAANDDHYSSFEDDDDANSSDDKKKSKKEESDDEF